jgi:hypothetical protein
MWSLRILSGPLAGKIFKLKEGENLIGRSPECGILLNSAGISKRHAKIIVSGQRFSVVDLQSSNGTFVNGIRIQSRIFDPLRDKVSFYDLLVAVEQEGGTASIQGSIAGTSGGLPSTQGAWTQGNLAMQSQPQMSPTAPAKNPVEVAQAYVDDVAMPGVYKLLELFELKQVLGGFILAFVFLVTLLSVIPLIRITKSSIEKESRLHARTIARNLAQSNLVALQQGVDSALSTRGADNEDNVQAALIVSAKDGHILAPVSKSGSYANEPFIHKARKQNREIVEQINDNLIGVSVPIRSFNVEQGGATVSAYAMVLYNMGGLAVDDGRTISLFVQTLIIALFLGAILFFFLYRLVEHPIISLNRQLDLALRDERKDVQTTFQIPSLQKLIFNINTALNRVSFGGSKEAPKNTLENKKIEITNLAQLAQNAVLILDKDRLVIFVNPRFEDLSGMRLASVQEQSLEILSDQALKLNIIDLIERCALQPQLIASNTLEISGQDFEIDAQAIMGTAVVEFYFVAIRKRAEDLL